MEIVVIHFQGQKYNSSPGMCVSQMIVMEHLKENIFTAVTSLSPGKTERDSILIVFFCFVLFCFVFKKEGINYKRTISRTSKAKKETKKLAKKHIGENTYHIFEHFKNVHSSESPQAPEITKHFSYV